MRPVHTLFRYGVNRTLTYRVYSGLGSSIGRDTPTRTPRTVLARYAYKGQNGLHVVNYNFPLTLLLHLVAKISMFSRLTP